MRGMHGAVEKNRLAIRNAHALRFRGVEEIVQYAIDALRAWARPRSLGTLAKSHGALLVHLGRAQDAAADGGQQPADLGVGRGRRGWKARSRSTDLAPFAGPALCSVPAFTDGAPR